MLNISNFYHITEHMLNKYIQEEKGTSYFEHKEKKQLILILFKEKGIMGHSVQGVLKRTSMHCVPTKIKKKLLA